MCLHHHKRRHKRLHIAKKAWSVVQQETELVAEEDLLGPVGRVGPLLDSQIDIFGGRP